MDSFNELVRAIQELHQRLQQSAVNAVNQSLTVRNWLIGFYIVEFEQNGKDRATYGDKLIDKIAAELIHIKGIDKRSLFRFRQFYLSYPQIADAIPTPLNSFFKQYKNVGTLSPFLQKSLKVGTVSPELASGHFVTGEKIIAKLSYSHLELLIAIDEPLKRVFYEIECIKGAWSVRELNRQISSLYFERSGLSKRPENKDDDKNTKN